MVHLQLNVARSALTMPSYFRSASHVLLASLGSYARRVGYCDISLAISLVPPDC